MFMNTVLTSCIGTGRNDSTVLSQCRNRALDGRAGQCRAPRSEARCVESPSGTCRSGVQLRRLAAVVNGSMFNIIHIDSITKIDFIVCKGTPYRETEFARRINARFGNHEVVLVSAEDLLLSKLVWAKDSRSEMQMNEVRNLLSAKADLDWEYLRQWASVLEVDETLQSLINVP